MHEAVHGVPFAPYALGNRLVRLAPGGIATEVIERLGHRALPLFAWVIIGATLSAAGLLGRRAPAVFGALALLLSVLAFRVDPVPHTLLHSMEAATCAALAAGLVAWTLGPPVRQGWKSSASPVDADRRRVLQMLLLGGGALALGGSAAARRLTAGGSSETVRADSAAGDVADAEFDAIAGLSALLTSRDDHYVVDINLDDPVVDGRAWRLKIGGAVADPRRYSLDELRAMPAVEEPVVLQCISNTVGGTLVGNALWTGVPLSSLLAAVAPDPDARMVVARAADGYTETIPLDGGTPDRVFVVFAMDGQLLPEGHGFPARLIFPGRYGMRSVKWLTELEVITGDDEGYWEKRGWDRRAVVGTASRIDVPAHREVTASPVRIAGVAWAGDRRISAVEVSADDGATWMPAELERESGALAWRRWRAAMALTPGVYALLVRAYDGTGAAQPAERRSAHPSGASGYHRVVVTVR
ncbi:MAG: molybdopterin-dependent oxidoreductase [Chloroflexi bacterium]|nr:molybdopterin-dependent oxidoreductase [Chloroflexota bacterium]